MKRSSVDKDHVVIIYYTKFKMIKLPILVVNRENSTEKSYSGRGEGVNEYR